MRARFAVGDQVVAGILLGNAMTEAGQEEHRGVIVDGGESLSGRSGYIVEFAYELRGHIAVMAGESARRRWCQERVLRRVSLLELVAEAAHEAVSEG